MVKHPAKPPAIDSVSAANGDAAPRPADEVAASPLLRGLSILEAYLDDADTLSVGDLSRKLGLHKSTVSRFAGMLEGAGYLERASGHGRYRLGSRLAALGARVSPQVDLRQTARPTLLELRDACGETVHLGIREGIEVITIDFVDGLHTIRMHTSIGKRSPVHCSAMGKAILALMPETEVAALRNAITFVPRTERTRLTWGALSEDLAVIRARGYALDDQELLLGLSCVGAPIVGRDGAAVAAISISGPSQRIAETGTEWLAERVIEAAARISSRLGAPLPGSPGRAAG
jgi:DNA-binding IclR family transcriptional regulator